MGRRGLAIAFGKNQVACLCHRPRVHTHIYTIPVPAADPAFALTAVEPVRRATHPFQQAPTPTAAITAAAVGEPM